MAQCSSDDEVKLAFVAALDAWVSLEHALGKLFYILLKPIAYPRSQIIFDSINGFQAQRETIAALMEDTIADEPLRERVSRLLDRARGLATKRNRLVHGRWKHHEGSRRGQKFIVLFRVYMEPKRSVWGPRTPTWLYDLKGKLVFFLDDLKRCENEFQGLANEVNEVLEPVASALGVSPHIEIPAEAELGLTVRTSPRSGHPPETP